MTGPFRIGLLRTGLVRTSQVGTVQHFFGPEIFWTQHVFGPKMLLRMEFDSGVDPTCFVFSLPYPNIFLNISKTMPHSEAVH